MISNQTWKAVWKGPVGRGILLAAWAWVTVPVPVGAADIPGASSRKLAEQAVEKYAEAAIQSLAEMVAFKTVNEEHAEPVGAPPFRAMKSYLEEKAKSLGFEYQDHGVAVSLLLGDSPDRIGVLMHGDVQPADPSKWARSPFTLDTESEPGKLVARGAEDDKGSIATALYALKTLKDSGLALTRTVELLIVFTEESNWEVIKDFVARYEPPPINISLDGGYPVIVAEKGWAEIKISLPPDAGSPPAGTPAITSFLGGVFLSQVPEDASATILNVSDGLELRLRKAADQDREIQYSIELEDDALEIRAKGRAVHSAGPAAGRNALTHLAALLAAPPTDDGSGIWADTREARMIRLINNLVGLGHEAELFGNLAYSDPFMGPLTLTLARVRSVEEDMEMGMSIRWPVGRDKEEIQKILTDALVGWKTETGTHKMKFEILKLNAPYYMKEAPQVPVLLSVFRHYTGQEEAKPLSMGGGTIAKLFPTAVNFGPSMPGEDYTGHTEHEFVTREQFVLNLRMYTAALAELASAVSKGEN